MTIREVEELVGLPRASIRFYEREGLLCPARGENGYRDYSREDVDTLEKIKLLRQVGLSVEEIAALQRGEGELAAVLGRRLEELERQAAETAGAAEVCRRMQADRASYATLEPGRYREELSAQGGGALDADVLPTLKHPWRRFFARGLDFELYSLLWLCIEVFGLRMNPLGGGVATTLLRTIAGWGLSFLLEPLLLCTWGYTPGKWLFGLQVRDENGEKLTWLAALGRLGSVFANGEGYGVPFYQWWRNWKCYRLSAEGLPCPWEEEGSYTIRDDSPLRCVGYAVAEAALVGLSVLVVLTGYLPTRHGPLSVENYVANINAVARWQGIYQDYTMDANGVWHRTNSNVYTLFAGDGPSCHELTVEDGVVTAIRLKGSGGGGETEDFFLYTGERDRFLALFVALNHNKRLGTPALLQDKIYRYDSFSDTTFERGGWRLTYTVEQEGYRGAGDYFINENHSPDAWYRWKCVIERVA